MRRLLHIVGRDDIAVVDANFPPINALSAGLRKSLYDTLLPILSDASIGGGAIAGSGRAFSAGADVAGFQAAPGAFAVGTRLETTLDAMSSLAPAL